MNADPPAASNQSDKSLTRFALDSRLIGLIVAAIIAITFFLFKNHEAFPQASIDLKLTKSQIAEMAVGYAKQFGFHKDKLIKSTTFLWDETGKTYLELELGAAKANELMRSGLPIWYWRTKLCKEYDPEQFYTCISPTGQLVSFRIDLQNDTALPSLAAPEALSVARKFAEQHGERLTDYTLVEQSPTELAKRTDYAFVWEDKKHPIKEATKRVLVRVSGNQVTSFAQYLYVPEQWLRKFQTIRSYNNTLGRIAFVFNAILYLAAMCLFIWSVTSKNAKWRLGACAGLLVAIGYALLAVNNLPDYIDRYSPETSFGGYLGSYTVETIGECFRAGLFSALLVMAGEFMYRLAYPRYIALENVFSRRSFGTVELSRGLIAGICLFGIALGWVVCYYVAGSHFGFWCPLDIGRYEILGSGSPAYSALCLGVQASFSEEILYRVIGLGLARRFVRNFWLANLIQAAAWGFAHSTYPQQPAYARGVELTISGLFFGWLMHNFGVLPCILGHYLLDAFLTAQPLFASSQTGLAFSGALPLIPFPLLACFAVARSRTRPVDPDPLENEHYMAKPEPQAEPPERHPFKYEPLTSQTRTGLLIATALSILFCFFTGTPQQVGSDYKVKIDRYAAQTKAWEIMRDHQVRTVIPGHNVAAWNTVSWLTSSVSSLEMQYLFENVGMKKTMSLADATQPGYFWRVRFFNPMQAEEYEVDIDGNGKEIDFDVQLPDDAPGASLSESDARKIAEAYVAKTHSQYFPFVNLTPETSTKKNRIDYKYAFRVPQQKVADAESKVFVNVIGDKISEFAQGWIIPDQWKWNWEKTTTQDEILKNIRYALYTVLLVMSVWWVIGLLRVGYFPFRPAILFGTAMTVLYLPVIFNSMIDIFREYSTTMQTGTFYVNLAVRICQSIVGRFGQFGLTMLVALPCARLLAPTLNPISLMTTTFSPGDETERQAHKQVWLDAALITIATLTVLVALENGVTFLKIMYSPGVQIDDSLDSICDMLNTYVPSLDLIVDAITYGVSILLLVPVACGFYAKYLKNFWVYFAFILIFNIINASGERFWQDFVIDVAWAAGLAALSWFLIAKLARMNVLAYLMIGIAVGLGSKLPAMWAHAPKLLGAEATACGLLLLAPVFYVIYLFVSKRSNLEPAPPPVGQSSEQ